MPDDSRTSTSRSLTLRGRAVLAAGITTLACGFGLVERDLARIGVLATAAPLVSLAYVARREPRLGVRREASPPSVPAGGPLTVLLGIDNAGRDTGLLHLEEQIDPALGPAPGFSLPSVTRGASRDLLYRLRPERRGDYALGPLQIAVRDPLGLAELRHVGDAARRLLVTPPTTSLADIGLASGQEGAGGELARAFSVGDVADATVRDYRRGDDLRRVHWPSTARTGELMVRREEQPLQSSATVLLDNRSSVSGDDLERSVSAAASACRHLVEHGYDVSLVTTDHVVTAGGREAPLWSLLRELATVSPSRTASWPATIPAEEAGLLIAVIAGAHPERHAGLRGFDAGDGQALAVLLDPTPGATDWLGRLGWRCTTWSSRETLSAAWERLGPR